MTNKPHIQLFQTVESTHLEARNGFSTAQHGDAWIADSQTGGRGRRDQGGSCRTWFSPPGKNIYLSLVANTDIPAQQAPFITLATGASVINALEGLFGPIPELWLKWPNDLYVGRKKLAGILTEGVFSGSEFLGAVIGIGLNVLKVESLPDEIRGLAISLEEALEPTLSQNEAKKHPFFKYDRLSIALILQQTITQAVTELAEYGFGHIYPTICKYDRSSDKAVVVTHQGKELEGIATGITPEGKLAVRLSDHSTIEVNSGEAKFKLNN